MDYTIHNQKEIRTLDNGGLVLHNADTIRQAKNILKEYSKLDNVPSTAHVYISFSRISASLGYHCDTSDVFYLQAIGSTLWNLENKDYYKLNPGDSIYVPRGTYHQVSPQGPRAGISFGLDY